MKKTTLDKKADKSLSDNELMNVTGGISICDRFDNKEECVNSYVCYWSSKGNYCYTTYIE